MNSIEFLAIRKLQQVHDQTDYDISLFLEAVDGGDGTMEAALEGAMVEVADESYRPQGYPTPPVKEVASRPNGERRQAEGSQGPSVVDRGGPDIKWRWAKEAVGLTALELNEAYAEFSVTEDGWSSPNGKLHSAAERLGEVMQRLGITSDDLPF